MKIIEWTDPSGKKLLINSDNIETVRESNDNTCILHMVSGHVIQTNIQFDSIFKIVREPENEEKN